MKEYFEWTNVNDLFSIGSSNLVAHDITCIFLSDSHSYMRVSDGEIRSGRVIFHATSRSGAKQRGAPKLDERWMERLVEEYRVEQMFIRGEIEDQDLKEGK